MSPPILLQLSVDNHSHQPRATSECPSLDCPDGGGDCDVCKGHASINSPSTISSSPSLRVTVNNCLQSLNAQSLIVLTDDPDFSHIVQNVLPLPLLPGVKVVIWLFHKSCESGRNDSCKLTLGGKCGHLCDHNLHMIIFVIQFFEGGECIGCILEIWS
jgi:hypothetical protein